MTEKPHIFKSIFISIIGFIVFYLSFIVLTLLFGSIVTFLWRFSAIRLFLRLFFIKEPGDSYFFIYCPCLYTACNFTITVISKLAPNYSSHSLSQKIVGVTLIVLNVLSLVINIISHSSWTVNILVIIAGLLLFFSA